MSVKIQDISPEKKKTQLLCSFVLGNSNQVPGLEKTDAKISNAIRQSIKEIQGKLGKISIINTLGRLPAQRILLVGLGNDITNDTFRFAAGKIALKAKEIGVSEFSIVVPKSHTYNQFESAAQIVEGAKMSLFSFDTYKSKKDTVPEISILVSESAKMRRVISDAQKIADAVIFTKEIANLPPNYCTPTTLANISKTLAKNRIKCTVISKAELQKRGFGGISAVGQGSKNEPKLIVLEYKGGRADQRPTVIVGKAVTFDTGGISLKPGEKMEEMKFDKCGGCTVLGIMKAVSELKIPQNIVGIIPSVENMPGGESYRPGDIIKLYSKKTAEIVNTDAEGRLILADALTYGEKKYSPKAIIDFATLTGACIVALGTNVAAMITNDQKLADKFKASSEHTTEEVWQLPLNDDYMNMIKSDVADIKNMGIARAAGTITAAAFLKEATQKTPWIHFDIAGVAWTQTATKSKPYNPKGATGFGVRLVLDYFRK